MSFFVDSLYSESIIQQTKSCYIFYLFIYGGNLLHI